MDSILGKTILGYKVKEKIGTGGFGNVYKVERNNIVGNVTRALKVITLPKENQYLEVLNSMGGDHKKADEYFKKELDRVVNEIRVFSMISEKDNHNIVSYYENDVEKIGEYKYNIYILMELVTPLDKWLCNNNLTVSQAIDISLDITKGLEICHENNIMHRDIKLNNIFVSKDGKFKLGDFGVSKKLDTLTRSHTIKGTPHYIAPEIYVKNEKYNHSADLYSLGILMYYLFNKKRYPFYPDYPNGYEKEDEDRAFYKRMQFEKPKNPVCAPDSIAEIVLKTLASPESRYTEAEEIIKDLENAKKSLSAEILDTKIGFEPENIIKQQECSKKEQKKVEELERSTIRSISFDEHSIDTGLNKTSNKKILAIVLPIVIIAIVLIFTLGDWSKQEIVNAPVETTKGQQTSKINTVKIKNYFNQKYKEVIIELETQGIKIKKRRIYNESIKKGRIISQNIKAGKEVAVGSSIVLTVSRGKRVTESNTVSTAWEQVVETTIYERIIETTTQEQSFETTTQKQNNETPIQKKNTQTTVVETEKNNEKNTESKNVETTAPIENEGFKFSDIVE